MSQQSEEGCTYVVVDEVGEEPEESVIIIVSKQNFLEGCPEKTHFY